DSLLAPRSDQEVDRRQPGGVQALVEGRLVDLVGRNAVLDAPPGGIHDLLPARVIERDAQPQRSPPAVAATAARIAARAVSGGVAPGAGEPAAACAPAVAVHDDRHVAREVDRVDEGGPGRRPGPGILDGHGRLPGPRRSAARPRAARGALVDHETPRTSCSFA